MVVYVYRATLCYIPRNSNFKSDRCENPIFDIHVTSCIEFEVVTAVQRYFLGRDPLYCRPQWPRGLRHELSALARTLRPWVRITLKAWMSVCVFSVFVLSCVYVEALRRADPLFKESYRL
jgi:hypothetical protein